MTESPVTHNLRTDLSIDQRHALRTAATRLQTEFDGTAGQRLHALARVEGKVSDCCSCVLTTPGAPKMALGYFNHLAGDQAVAWSGGSEPGREINPAAIEVMAEVGIDITGEYPKPWTDEIVQAADVVITMGCGDACPVFPGKRYENWNLPDPAGQSTEATRPIRDDIAACVRHLLAELGVPVNR